MNTNCAGHLTIRYIQHMYQSPVIYIFMFHFLINSLCISDNKNIKGSPHWLLPGLFPFSKWKICAQSSCWFYSSSEVWCLQCVCRSVSTSPLRARLLALPWKRPFFPAPFPWSISNTLERTKNHAVSSSVNIFNFLNKYVVVSLTVVPSQSLVHWVQPAEINQAPFLLQQWGKLRFPTRRETRLNKTIQLLVLTTQQSGYDLTSVFISLAIIFMNSLSPSFLEREKETSLHQS